MNYIVLLLVTVSVVRAVVQIDTVPQLNLTQYVGRWYQVTVAYSETAPFHDCYVDRCMMIGLQNILSRKDVIVHWQIVRRLVHFIDNLSGCHLCHRWII